MDISTFTQKWDNGSGLFNRANNGTISAKEIASVSGHYPQFVRDLDSLSETDKVTVLAMFGGRKVAAKYLDIVYPGMVNKIDKNGNGCLSRSEFRYGNLHDITPLTALDRPVLTDSGILGRKVRKMVKWFGIPQRDMSLLVKPEKASYYRGEPVAFDVELKAGPNLAGALLYQKNLENIRFKSEAVGFSPVGTNRGLGEPTEFASAQTGETFHKAGVGRVSFPVSKWHENSPQHIVADFYGYKDPWRETSYGFRLLIKTPITEEEIKLSPEAAYNLFMIPEAQKFMYGLGKVQDAAGQQAMKSIVNDHPESVYAAYANLVLGLEQLVLNKVPTAKPYLDASNRNLLGPTFQAKLDAALVQADGHPVLDQYGHPFAGL